MARIRTIKPEFWTSAQVMECSPIARLLFIGLWNFADDHGRMTVSDKTLKAQVFPADDISAETVRGMVVDLSKNDLIKVYTVDGKEYLQITGWHHQRIDKPRKSVLPPFPSSIPDNSKNDRGAVDALSTLIYPKDAAPSGASASPPSAPEKELFDRGKQVLGKEAGGLIAKLLSSKGRNVADARAVIETASNKQNPREYVGAVVRGQHATDADQFKKIEEVMRRKGSAVVFDTEVEGGIPGI